MNIEFRSLFENLNLFRFSFLMGFNDLKKSGRRRKDIPLTKLLLLMMFTRFTIEKAEVVEVKPN